jgi:hypothetical protein
MISLAMTKRHPGASFRQYAIPHHFSLLTDRAMADTCNCDETTPETFDVMRPNLDRPGFSLSSSIVIRVSSGFSHPRRSHPSKSRIVKTIDSLARINSAPWSGHYVCPE